MAESILSDLAAGLISKVGSLLLNEIVLWWGVEDELRKLEETVGTIKAVLLDAEEKSSHNHQVKQWLGMLSEAMYDAEDSLDEFSYEALHQQLMGGSGTSKKVRLFFSRSNQAAFGLKMVHKVKELRERLDGIAANRKFHLEERSYVFVPLQTHSSPPQVVIGRDHDKERIVELLRSSDCVENVSVVAVVGIGGLGKTTLAQMVYNDDKVNHFELKMWVCVSDDFDVQLLVKKVIESATKQAPSCNEMEPLKDLLHGQIKGKKYLLVLDDVWNEEVNKWSSFVDLFADGAKGSKILITTRSTRVAETSRATASHELEGLPNEESWSLFKQVAFSQRHQLNPSREAIGKEIVKKCCGVPLAIKSIAGVLYSKDPDTEWGPFKDDELSKIDVFKKDIEPILRLSYNHLPSPYKRCFAYCCLFPKDYDIPVDKLIQLWEAQGYVQPTNENESVRDISLKYFKELLRLSFFQDVEKDRFDYKYCKMHDLMHDLAVSVAGDNFYPSSDRQMTSFKNNPRHMSVGGYNMRYESSWLKMKNMRTILKVGPFKKYYLKRSEADAIFCYLRRLRVLELHGMGIRTLPSSIYKMKLLRYLDLSFNDRMKKLPESLVSLHNLQGLNLQRCSNLRKLPSDMSKLVNLTDLNIDGCDNLNYLPSGIGKLTKLEKLSKFVIAKDKSISKHSARLDELHSLDNLRGELEIRNLSFLASEFREGLLSSKQNLEKLKLDWGDDNANNVGDQEMVMEALCPHTNLKALEVLGYKGLRPPSWLPSITNLVEVKIKFCSSIQRLPPLDQLLHLQTLEISRMAELESIEVEYGGGSSLFFPSLTHLTLFRCPKLKGFEGLSSLSKEEIPCFPCLSHLHIGPCPNLIHLPLSAELEFLQVIGVLSLIEILMMPMNSAITLSKLQWLDISHMEDCTVNVLNDGMLRQSLEALYTVSFHSMINMVSLPKGLQHATTLRSLYIYDCPSLECIPEWMTNLIALQDLIIRYCPRLEERCKNDSAEDWHKISHIPNIQIGGTQIQSNGRYLL